MSNEIADRVMENLEKMDALCCDYIATAQKAIDYQRARRRDIASAIALTKRFKAGLLTKEGYLRKVIDATGIKNEKANQPPH